ncbi:MAG: 3-hydroxyacyl-CoA dehydrogenase family protein [Candidatus Lokiarchaeota archaeon]|nr:3-hydroxyacyl-CoA dehydrogenase family protein [Candidatus Lokiarchaeota archaeon]
MVNIKSISVIGAGTMGHEIAQVALMGGFKPVILNDLSYKILEKAENKIEDGLKRLEVKGKLREGFTASGLMKNLIKEVDLKKAVSNADFIIEAIPELMQIKQQLFEKLGKYSPKHAILATNTSTMSITEIASSSGRSDRVVGCHFFTPIVVLRLIEIIKGRETSENTVVIAKKVCQQFPALKGKRFLPVLEKESPGFIVNRLTIGTSAYINWLLDFAMEKGIPLEQIDADTKELMEIGPFARWDYLGLDVIYNALNYFKEVLSDDFTPGKTLTKLVNNKDLGRKTGKGLFKWMEGRPLINMEKCSGILDLELFMAIQLNEGCKLLEEGIVSGYKIIDDTMLAGMDLPGPFGAGKRNYKNWTNLLEDFVEKSGLTYLKPCELMKSGKFIQMRK